MYYRAILFILLFSAGLLKISYGQKTDTLRSVEIFSARPAQDPSAHTLSLRIVKSTINTLNSFSVAEAARFLPGVQVKDYGGIGGLKTVSLRSLGANYTTVLYNGIPISDAQSGQIDLGKYSLDHVELIEYTLNRPTNNLAPASAFKSAAIINISSATSVDSFTVVNAGLHTGSFGLINPFASLKLSVQKNTSLSISANWLSSTGKYLYRDYEDADKKKERIHSNIRSARIESSLFHKFSDSTWISWQNYYQTSDRGLPGAVVLYASPLGDKLVDENFFSQIQFKTRLAKKLKGLFMLKYETTNSDYTDPDYPNTAGKLENFFKQQTIFGSAAVEWKINRNWSLHYANDLVWDRLNRIDSFMINFQYPRRFSFLQNAGLLFKRNRFSAQADVLHMLIRENVRTGNPAVPANSWSPGFSANLRLGERPIFLRSSFKYLYRYPTFNELYFTNIGNTNLRPEAGRLFNIGIIGQKRLTQNQININWSVDGFYERVTDKILAIPRQNLFQWSMMNIGKSSITGADVVVSSSVPIGDFRYHLELNYSYQQALDLSDPQSIAYKKQLAYSPVHSGTLRMGVRKKSFDAGYNILFTGKRYRSGGEQQVDRMPSFLLHDLYASYSLHPRGRLSCLLRAEANNVLNRQYEIVRYYPMPGFNYRITLIITYKKQNQHL